MANQVSLKKMKVSDEEMRLMRNEGIIPKRILKFYIWTSGEDLQELIEAKVSPEGEQWLTALEIKNRLPFCELNYSSESVGRCLSALGFENKVMRVQVREGSKHTEAKKVYKCKVI